MAKKYVYLFSKDKNEGNGTMKDLLGGKGANLAEMAKIGLPVPAGITITTESCIEYYKNGEKVPKEVEDQMLEGLKELEKINGKKLGDKNDPLLVSVRSGAKMSMPGMMDTILNLGLNDESVEGLAKKTKNERFAWDSYRRFIAMYGDVVMGVEKSHFEHLIRSMKKNRKVTDDTQLTTDDLKQLVKEFKALYKKESGKDFPQDPLEQLRGARNAVFQSWNNPRAITYRRMYKIPDEIGTAVNVQTMVFGNKGESSATGVAFTRNPSTGENEFFGEYLLNAQGEDVVAGIRTGKKIVDMGKELPKTYKELLDVRKILESNFKDVQDFEFTVEEGKLYMLQTRNGKRTGQAAVRIAVEMEKEGL
ncbi:MAG TPA: PEP/pyruvate-binding domain-containing protein, partial [Candidatus Wallbacteria bacterium]|nr:PEP/pyruvate-binding domain-containing protein [Candidatus Wallbacteria bacterium]